MKWCCLIVIIVLILAAILGVVYGVETYRQFSQASASLEDLRGGVFASADRNMQFEVESAERGILREGEQHRTLDFVAFKDGMLTYLADGEEFRFFALSGTRLFWLERNVYLERIF